MPTPTLAAMYSECEAQFLAAIPPAAVPRAALMFKSIFYSGAATMFEIIFESITDDMSDDEGAQVFSRLQAELTQFAHFAKLAAASPAPGSTPT